MRILKVWVTGALPKRGGSKLEYPEKPPNSQPENWCHILDVKIHRPSSPRYPLTLMISSLGQNALALTH